MPTGSEVINSFREHIDSRNTSDLKIIYRIAGGIPSHRIEKRIILTGSGRFGIKSFNKRREEENIEGTSEIDENAAETIIRESLDSIGNMVPRAEARFLPDSLVGSITFEVGGHHAIYFFRPRPSIDTELNNEMPVIPLDLGQKFDNLFNIITDR